MDNLKAQWMRAQPQHRVAGLLVYAVILAAIQYFIIETRFTPNQNAIWLFNGVASLLFGSRLLNPHFTPPADAAANGFIGFASLLAGSLALPANSADAYVLWGAAALCGAVLILSLVVLFARAPVGSETRTWVRVIDQSVRGIGSPSIIFTLVILATVWLFHRDRPIEVFAIVGVWTTIVAIQPVEALLSYRNWLVKQSVAPAPQNLIGEIAAHQSPGIVLVRQVGEGDVERGTPLLVADDNGPWLLGVALNYVGRDEGNLLRVLTTRLPGTLKCYVDESQVPRGTGIAMKIDAEPGDLANVSAIQWINRLCGIVDSDTTLDFLQFEVVEHDDLSEGRLVETRVGPHRAVYQIIEGLTREEIVQQKNKFGYARAKARKVGRWDEGDRAFKPVGWLPRINSSVFLMETEEFEPVPASIGHFPGTAFGVSIDPSDLVTHNTAILGILGIGKSYLAIELVERMIASGIKVICLDLTDQYAQALPEFIDEDYESHKLEELSAAGRGGVPKRIKEQGGSHRAFQTKVAEQLREFLNPANRRYLRIYNPARFEVTRQTSGMYEGEADMATLTPSEITAIISDAALQVCQELSMTDEARACLVYEEAHSLVPEWNSIAAEGDKAATARSARAILQGRKYGLGCLLITQRTANVTKTILNQCNTIFAMRTFDDTGKEFLSNYIGREYAGILPNIEARHAVVFGKAASCENPVLIRLNDRDRFIDVFRRDHPPPQPPVELPQEEQEAAVAAEPRPDLDDEIPF